MEKIILTEDKFIGKGLHKKTYIHPDDALCVKVGYSKEGCVDLEREISYRKASRPSGLKNQHSPEVLRGVQTNLGQGHVFERVMDYDGKEPLTLKYYLENKELLNKHYDKIVEVLTDFKRRLFDDKVLTMELFPHNIYLQKVSDEIWRPILINDMGSAALLPIEYYVDYFRKAKIQRRWERFVKRIEDRYDVKFVLK